MNVDAHEPEFEPLDTQRLTWAALLGRWVEFARSGVALPDDDDGRRMRESIADVIMLQAVWFALRDVEQLDADERALGLDRAAILIDKHTAALVTTWHGRAMPTALRELIDDAKQELAKHHA